MFCGAPGKEVADSLPTKASQGLVVLAVSNHSTLGSKTVVTHPGMGWEGDGQEPGLPTRRRGSLIL